MAVPIARRKFSVDEYQKMAAAGILGEDDRVELIDGEIINMAPVGDHHNSGFLRVSDLFYDRLGRTVLISSQGPIRLGRKSEPQPDVMLLRRRPDYYRSGLPEPSDVYLVVEVSDTSLEFDRQVKVRHYARSGVKELWIVDLEHDTLLVFREPSPSGYRITLIARRGESVSPLAFPEVTIPIADVLG